VLSDPLVLLVTLVTTVSTAPRELLVYQGQPERLGSPDPGEELDLRDLREPPGPGAWLATLDPLDRRETLESRESLVTPDPRGPLALLVRREREDLPVSSVPPDLPGFVEPEVALELVDCPAWREDLDPLVCPVTVVPPAPLEPVEPPVMPAVLVSLV